MQRVKLYNLHKVTCFIVTYFAFKMDKLLSNQISTPRKNNTNEKFLFSCFMFLSLMQIVQLLMLRLATYFVFIYKNTLGSKKGKIRKKTNSPCTKEKSLLHCESIFESKMSNY